MKFVALVSGGKDSIYSILECLRQGHELVGCVHLSRPARAARGGGRGAGGEQGDNDDHDDDVTGETSSRPRLRPHLEEEGEEESYMYQTSGSEAVRVLVEQCLGVPFLEYKRRGRSINTSLVYFHHQDYDRSIGERSSGDGDGDGDGDIAKDDDDDRRDEVEDLYCALALAKKRWCDDETGESVFQGVSSGAILSTYQRVRVENVCGRLGLTSLGYLWRAAPQPALLRRMVENCVEAVLVRSAAPPGLSPRRHLIRSTRELEPHFLMLHERYQFHVCGEGGEYETLVVDSPIYRRRLVLDRFEIAETDDGVGELRILACHAEDKDAGIDEVLMKRVLRNTHAITSATALTQDIHATEPDHRNTSVATVEGRAMQASDDTTNEPPTDVSSILVRIMDGGLMSIGDIRTSVSEPASATKSETDLAVREALEVFRLLRLVLQHHGCTPQDVFMVHLYLSDIEHFATINRHYRDCFGVVLPPSRVCVGLGRTQSSGRVQLVCLVRRGSGASLRSAGDSRLIPLRQVLHVQSLSHWAPVCIGPYSQVNTVAGCHFVAGQIGLDPPTMRLPPSSAGWQAQLDQAWRNTARILDSLGGATLHGILAGMVYVKNSELSDFEENAFLDELRARCDGLRSTNAGVSAGEIDGLLIRGQSSRDRFEGYEDEETRQALSGDDQTSKDHASSSPVPLLVVAVAELPAGADVEIEVVSSTCEAHATLTADQRFVQHQMGCARKSLPRLIDVVPTLPPDAAQYEFGVHLLSLGSGAISVGLVTAYSDEDHSHLMLNCEPVMTCMLQLLSKACRESPVHIPPILHLRLYYDARSPESAAVDIELIRASIDSATLTVLGQNHQPTTSTIPTMSIGVLLTDKWSLNHRSSLAFAIQVIMIDPDRAETDLWVHHRR